MEIKTLIDISYLIGAIFFVIGIRRLSSPDTARAGNILAAVGMAIAIVATMFVSLPKGDNNYVWIIGAMILGGIIGAVASKRVPLTAMPQLVSMFNGLGGACAVVIAAAEVGNWGRCCLHYLLEQLHLRVV